MPTFRANAMHRAACLAVLMVLGPFAHAQIQPIDALPLQPDGDVHILPAGVHTGTFRIDQAMHLRCAEGAILDAQGEGHGLIVGVPGVRVEGCEVRNWGRNLTTMDSGIYLEKQATGAEVLGNRLRGPGFGIWVDGTTDVLIEGNDVEGDVQTRSQDRGNGIQLFAVKGARVIRNHLRHVRDGVYIDTSNGNLMQGNLIEDVRYGVHYMFANNNQLLDNVTRRTRTGYALMQSRQLTVIGNRSEFDQNYGILMNYITYSTLRDNLVSDVQQGTSGGGDGMISGAEGKALFIYNSLFNSIEDNIFQRSSLGIHLTAGSEDNKIASNAFIDNQQQVKYVATREQEWSQQGRGNYWSDYLGWDRNGDGLGDVAYEPNDNVDRLLWTYPQVRLLLNSPGVELLRWVQRAFPVVRSPGVRDSHPLMHAPEVQP